LKLYRIILPVDNIDKAVQFYSSIFEEKGIRVSVNRHYFNLGGIILALMKPEVVNENGNRTWKFHENQNIYIAVNDLDSVYERTKKAGCKYLGEIEKMPWGEKLFYAHDCFDNPICFVDEKSIFTGQRT